MNFRYIIKKIAKHNIKKNTSYIICNCLSIMFFLMLKILIDNDSFKKVYTENSDLKMYIYVAFITIILFSTFFINYTYTILIKSRSKEFGLYMV